MLGVVGTALAFVIYYKLIAEVGAGRAALVSYLAPGVALFYGAIFLDEAITVAAVGGLVLILGGVALASRPASASPRRAPIASASPVDLTLSPAERGVPRHAARRGSRSNHPGREPEGDEESFEFRRAWQRKLNERGWAGLTLADRVRRRGRDADRAGDLLRGDRPRAARRRWPTCSA